MFKTKVLKRIAIALLLIIFLVLLVIEVLMRNIPTLYIVKETQLLENAENIETLGLGNSNTVCGIDPDVIPNSFNYGLNGEAIDYTYLMLQKLNPVLPKLKTVIVPVTPLFFYSTTDESDFKYYYMVYYGFPRSGANFFQSRFVSANYSEKILFYYYIKGYYKKNDYSYFEATKFVEVKKGYFQIEDRLSDINQEMNILVQNRFKQSQRIQQIANDPERQKYIKGLYDQFVEYCNVKKLNVLFIVYPVANELYKKFDPRYLNDINEIFKNYQMNYPNVKFLDLMQDSTFTTNDFMNIDHLNKFGAKKISAIINTKLAEFK